jgi:hypothetical protein
VPKDRGPVEYLATLIVKALVKHGWPAKWQPSPFNAAAFYITYDGAHDLPDDFARAVDIAVRIVARTYRVEVQAYFGQVELLVPYRVTSSGQFREIAPET